MSRAWILCGGLALVLLVGACGGSDFTVVPGPAPMATSVVPNTGPGFGTTLVTLTGTNFTNFTVVTVGGKAVNEQTLVNSTTITFKTPANNAGAADVTVTGSNGSHTLPGAFTYGQTDMWGADGKTGQAGNLYGINPVTGEIGAIGPIGFAITGMVYWPGDGNLYGTQSSQGNASNLIRIDPLTGAGTIVGPLQEGGGSQHNSIAGLTIEGGQLLGWSENGDEPVRININTGEVTLIGGGTGSAGSGIATNAGGTVYSATEGPNGTLDTVNPATGVVTVGPTMTGGAATNTGEINAMTFFNGTLYALGSMDNGDFGSEVELYTVNTTTGALTLLIAYPVGTDNGRGMDAIASRNP